MAGFIHQQDAATKDNLLPEPRSALLAAFAHHPGRHHQLFQRLNAIHTRDAALDNEQ